MRRFVMVLSVGAIMAMVLSVSIIPAMTQTSEGGNGRLIAQADDKAAKKAARQAWKAAKQVQHTQNATPAQRTARKQLPASGGFLSGNVALLGLGVSTLIASGGLFLVGRRTVGPR